MICSRLQHEQFFRLRALHISCQRIEVYLVDLGAFPYESLNHLKVALLGGNVQRSFAFVVAFHKLAILRATAGDV